MNIPQSQDANRSTPVLEFKNVNFSWPDGHGLNDVSFAVFSGQFVLISGPSGAGKSTLLRLAVRLEEASHGTILFRNTSIDTFYPPELRSKIGFVQQTPVIIPGSVRDNLLMPFTLQVRKKSVLPEDKILMEWMEKLALDRVSLNADAGSLSVGQRQRICLIRTILTKPDVICFDEPTSSLDHESRVRVEGIAEDLAGQSVAILMVNHTSYHPVCPHMHITVEEGKVEVML